MDLLGADHSTIEWEWRLEDHLPWTDLCPLDIQYDMFGPARDWTHANALTFDEGAGAIYVNVRNLNQLVKVAYPSGDIEWIMGDGGDFGAGLWAHSHSPELLPGNRVLVFDNGLHRSSGEPYYSRVVEITYDPLALTAAITWEYRETPDFFTAIGGGAVELGDGDVLITDANHGRIVEVTRAGTKAWELLTSTPAHIHRAQAVAAAFFLDW